MTSSFFYTSPEIKNPSNTKLIEELENFATNTKSQIYIISKPLGDNKYTYSYQESIVILFPKHKITFIDLGNNPEEFENYVEEFIEDIGTISDKYRYKEVLGRPKAWKQKLTKIISLSENTKISELLENEKLTDPVDQKHCELLISLLTGSINNIDVVRADIPQNQLDAIKRKIILFDGEQTRFIYQDIQKDSIRIQGLSGTGKTELLLHKLKELYTNSTDSKIAVTCHNKILASDLRRRIPAFFDFMKVEQQILWKERLWCVHAWGSSSDINSGVYRYICHYYDIPFRTLSSVPSFDKACSSAIAEIEQLPKKGFAFDHLLIDESQDFPASFINLCRLATKGKLFIAGDIFQNIFDKDIASSISPDFLLNKCYRTDPRTLMFAHALGMGLFENTKLNWLNDNEWKSCGYITHHPTPNTLTLTREPIRRFEDVVNSESMRIKTIASDFFDSVVGTILDTLNEIKIEHPTVQAEDVGIIFIDSNQDIYYHADQLEAFCPQLIGWKVNKSYESKKKVAGELFVSNRNNVKGLEFPFVICITKQINNNRWYRNALYMTLTRSFIKTFLITSALNDANTSKCIKEGLDSINKNGSITIEIPPNSESIRTEINQLDYPVSFYDFVSEILDEENIKSNLLRRKYYDLLALLGHDNNFDREVIRKVIIANRDNIKD